VLSVSLTSPVCDTATPIESSASAADVTSSHHFTRQRLERLAKRRGLQLVETRHQFADPYQDGGFGLVDWEAGMIAYGGGLPWPSATLDEVIDFLLSPDGATQPWRDPWRE